MGNRFTASYSFNDYFAIFLMQKYDWNIQSEEEVEDVITHLLDLRGVPESEREQFLNPDWDRDLIDPFTFKNMEAAVSRVLEAIDKEQNIWIHGDYDADGICGSALIFSGLKDIVQNLPEEKSPNIQVFLPDREKDGYGVAMHTVENLAEQGCDLLITVDCGIGNVEEVARARELGVDVIVCDHHQLREELPDAIIIHPLAPGETYENKSLCGTGVGFKLISSCLQTARLKGANIPVGHEKWYLDLVAIATVTDVMPILGENRLLEHYGLIVLEKTRRPGLKKLIDLARADKIDTTTIGFRIGPRINAAGRISHAKHAFDVLVAGPEDELDKLVINLDQLNRDRQKVSDGAYREARTQVLDNGLDQQPLIVVHSEDWHPGIVGLIAGKLVTEFGIPTFALTVVNGTYVGSGRSVQGLHLVECMDSCGDIYKKYGGHPQACGLTLASKDKLETFKEKATEFAKDYFSKEIPKPQIEIDGILPSRVLDKRLLDEVMKLQPFGEGNREPSFVTNGIELTDIKPVGKSGNHLKLKLYHEISDIDAIAFGWGKVAEDIQIGDKLDIVYSLSLNEWNGMSKMQLIIQDMKKH